MAGNDQDEHYIGIIEVLDDEDGPLVDDLNGGVDDDDDDDDEDEYMDYEEEAVVEDPDYMHFLSHMARQLARRVPSNSGPSMSSQEEAVIGDQDLVNVAEENEDAHRLTQRAETASRDKEKVGSEEKEIDSPGFNRSEIDGLFCPICMEAWSNGGGHRVCCLPCGHIFGMSCIKRWLQQGRRSRKCPQCNHECTTKDIRVLYASRIVAVDEELHEKVRSLEDKCASIEKKGVEFCKREVEWQKKEADLLQQVHQLKERTSYLEGLLAETESRIAGSSPAGCCKKESIYADNFGSEFGRQGYSRSFVLKEEFRMDGARLFDLDASNQILLVARRVPGMGGMHVLTKMSLMDPYDMENIELHSGTKAIKDIHMSPHGRLALLASLGKKLSVISTETNNTVLNYDLPAAAWSCSWDQNIPHYIYAGLQNGMLMEFDMRQTGIPVKSISGLTCNPIHTVHSLSPDLSLNSGVRTILTASSAGLCEWNFGGEDERPFLVPETENQGVCISLAYSPLNDDIVATFRPKVETSSNVAVSQTLLSPLSSSSLGQAIQGSHVFYRRRGGRNCYQMLGSTCASVNDVRLPKSVIINGANQMPLFACGDEIRCELVLQELPSLMVFQRLKPWNHPIHDVKYTQAWNSEMLSCLSKDVVHLFLAKSS